LLSTNHVAISQSSLINFPDSFKTSTKFYSPSNQPYTKSPFWGIISLGQSFDSLLTWPVRSSAYQYEKERVNAFKKSEENGLVLIVDTSQSVDCYEYIFWVKKEKQFYPDNRITFIENDIRTSISAKEIGQILFKGHPVYILNVSDTIMRLKHRRHNLPIIQEALDRDGQWKDIELLFKFPTGTIVSDVGFSPLGPGQMLVTSLYQYKGDFQTLLRAKIIVDGKIFRSAPFKGSINHSQITNAKSFRFN
jgi:hypothetical protein